MIFTILLLISILWSYLQYIWFFLKDLIFSFHLRMLILLQFLIILKFMLIFHLVLIPLGHLDHYHILFLIDLFLLGLAQMNSLKDLMNFHFLFIFIINFICFLMFNFFYLIYENLVCYLNLLKLFLDLVPSIIKFFFLLLIHYIKFLFFFYLHSLLFAI